MRQNVTRHDFQFNLLLRTKNLVSVHLMGEMPMIVPALVCESLPFSSLSLNVHVPTLYSTAFPHSFESCFSFSFYSFIIYK